MGNVLQTGWQTVIDPNQTADTQAQIGAMTLNIHRNRTAGGLPTGPLPQKAGYGWQYAICCPDSNGRQDLLVVIDAGYGKSELDAQVKACQALCSMFDVKARGLGIYVSDRAERKRLGLADVPMICLEVARVDIFAAQALLHATLQHAREDRITAPDMSGIAVDIEAAPVDGGDGV